MRGFFVKKSQIIMNIMVYAILFLIITMPFAGCSKSNEEVRKRAQAHSQEVIDHLYSDSIYSYFPKKYVSPDDVPFLISEFRRRCQFQQLKGGLEAYKYRTNVGKGDAVIFQYKYSCGEKIVKLQTHYLLLKDSFELTGFRFFFPDSSTASKD